MKKLRSEKLRADFFSFPSLGKSHNPPNLVNPLLLRKELGESLMGKWMGATGPRASERQSCLREGLWKGGFSEFFQRFSEFCRGFQSFLKEVFRVFRGCQSFFRGFRDPLRDPLRGRFPSQRLSVLLPLIVLPLELSPKRTQKMSGWHKPCFWTFPFSWVYTP